jgi:gamma-glutamyltranspeptidase / glutathione hydrolase
MLVPASWLRLSFSASVAPALLRVVVMLSLLKYALAASPLLLQSGANPVPDLEMRQASARKGAVASESDICSHIGIELLEQGGNAADAVSTVFVGECTR